MIWSKASGASRHCSPDARSLMRFRRALALVLLSAVAAGVGAPAGAAPRREPACTLLRDREIEQVIGAQVRQVRPEQPPIDASFCQWEVGLDGARGVAVYLTTGENATSSWATGREHFTGEARQRVNGLGKRAFYAVPVAAVDVLRRGTFIYVQNLDGAELVAPDALRDQAVELATIAFDRL